MLMHSKYAPKDKKQPTPVIKYPNYWSYSTWEIANQCLAKYKYAKLLKLPQPSSPALDRGAKIHKQGENYIDGIRKQVPTSFRLFAPEMRAIKKAGAVAEPNYAFTKTWKLTSPTDWKNCWLRIKVDVAIITPDEADIIDYKTGKPYKEKHAVQREIYGVGAFVKHGATLVNAEHWYLDSGEVARTSFDKPQLIELKKKWTALGKELVARRRFPAQPDVYVCKYCPFRSDKKLITGSDGPCSAWKKAK